MQLDDLVQAIEPMLDANVRAELFRRRRVRLLTSSGSPLVLADGCRFFIHIVPCGEEVTLNYRDKETRKVVYELAHHIYPANSGYNVDGFIRYAKTDKRIGAYVQHFRSGSIEFCHVFQPHEMGEPPTPFVAGDDLRRYVEPNVREGLKALKALGCKLPYFIGVTAANVKGWAIATGRPQWTPIDRDELWIDGIMVAEIKEPVWDLMIPAMDALSNASNSLQFNDEG